MARTVGLERVNASYPQGCPPVAGDKSYVDQLLTLQKRWGGAAMRFDAIWECNNLVHAAQGLRPQQPGNRVKSRKCLLRVLAFVRYGFRG